MVQYEKMKILFPGIFLCLLFANCVSTKYTYDFEKGKELNFSMGKWLLNKPYMNPEINRVYDIAVNDFSAILKDSLMEVEDLRGSHLIPNKMPYTPTKKELEDIALGSRCDYLINYKLTILSAENYSFTTSPPIGTVIRINEAMAEILIYDLNTLEVLSQSSAIGKVKVKISSEDSGGTYVNLASNISRSAFSRLIKRYEKYRIK